MVDNKGTNQGTNKDTSQATHHHNLSTYLNRFINNRSTYNHDLCTYNNLCTCLGLCMYHRSSMCLSTYKYNQHNNQHNNQYNLQRIRLHPYMLHLHRHRLKTSSARAIVVLSSKLIYKKDIDDLN